MTIQPKTVRSTLAAKKYFLQFRRVEANVVEIEDPFGPAIVDPTLQGGCTQKTCPSPILMKFGVHISL